MTQPPSADRPAAAADDDSAAHAPIEVEQKYRLDDVAALEQQLAQLGAAEGPRERHRDTYYSHPARDFRQTREALRIRRVRVVRPGAGTTAEAGSAAEEAITLVTYKGPYEPTGVKARPELEWRLDPCDPDGRNLAMLLRHLSLQEVLTVEKTRRPFVIAHPQHPLSVTIDEAPGLGSFAEVEAIAEGQHAVDACRALVASTAEQLRLRQVEKRSYLQMALEAAAVQAGASEGR